MNPLAYDDAQIDRELGSKSLREYMNLTWHQVEPARDMLHNWHMDAISEHLEAVTKGEITRLVMNVPPGSMKSLSCSVFWPSWTWTHSPEMKWITASYSGIISKRDSLRARRIFESDWFKARWGHLWKPNDDEWSSIKYSNTMGGFRLATTPSGSVTGEHGDIQLVDDPIKPLEAPGDKIDSSAIANCLEWWDETMSTRMADPRTSRRVIIMQRLHDADLAGHVLRSGGYEHLCLPMTAERKCVVTVQHKCSMQENAKGEETPPTSIGFKDPREEEELLWEDRFPPEVVKEQADELGPRGAAAQHQQRPTPAEGGHVEEAWFCFYEQLPKHQTTWIQSWDMSFKKTKKGSYVVGQVWCAFRGQLYLVDQVRERMDFVPTLKALLRMTRKYPRAKTILIEEAANGHGVISSLKAAGLPGIIAVGTGGESKESRFSSITHHFEARDIFLPRKDLYPWVEDYIYELTKFPLAGSDDQVDATSMAVDRLMKKARKGSFNLDLGEGTRESEFTQW